MSERNLELNVEQDADVTIISILSRRIPADLSDSFEERVVRTIARLEPPRVLLDFEGVQFLSSAILGKLIKLNGVVLDRDGQLKLCSLIDKIAEVFKITNLDRLFSIHDTRDKALRDFK